VLVEQRALFIVGLLGGDPMDKVGNPHLNPFGLILDLQPGSALSIIYWLLHI
jgi:hypothetical protein